MAAMILDGKTLAQEIEGELALRVVRLSQPVKKVSGIVKGRSP